MNPNQLKETTMDPATRSLLKQTLPSDYDDQLGWPGRAFVGIADQ